MAAIEIIQQMSPFRLPSDEWMIVRDVDRSDGAAWWEKGRAHSLQFGEKANEKP
jgi:hypothetical protein